MPPAGYLKAVREVCDRFNVLMIADEVITGFGRTGRWFAVERDGVVPDMLTFAKGVSSGYIPLGGVIMRKGIFDAFHSVPDDKPLMHGFTYSGHPVACAVALANIDIIERESLIPQVVSRGAYLMKRLNELKDLPHVGDVRGLGLMAAVELVRDKTAREPFPPDAQVAARVRAAALRRGVILRPGADLIVICPPLVVTREQIDLIVRVLGEAITEVAAELTGADSS